MALAKLSPQSSARSFQLKRRLTATSDFVKHHSRVWLIFTRNLGISVLNTTPIVDFSRQSEVPKIIVDKSFVVAWIRCSIHLLPLSVATFLVYFNLSGYFIGARLGSGPQAGNFLMLQIAAKVMVCRYF
jgi:hypothetical protein